jgi:magnesium-protoporphyrin IX monomethyl ester (oxidative) cyclase
MRVALIEAGSPGLNIYSHVAMGRGITLLATVLRDAGYDVRAFIEDIAGKGSVDWAWASESQVIGFSAITCTLTRMAELAAEARRQAPNAIILLGGPEPTCAPERAFEAGADYIIRGEGEHSLPAFLAAVGSGRPLPAAVADVPGIAWRSEGGIVFGPPPRQLTRDEVARLPLIDMSLVHDGDRRTTGLVWRSRGCPERCSFCEVHEIWPRYVLREEEKSVEELLRNQAEGCSNTFLIDDNAAANKPSFKRFLRGAIERGYVGSVAIQVRADAVLDALGRPDRELLRLLRDVAPMTMLCVGVESADDDDLSEVGKRLNAERMAKGLAAMRRYGLLVHGMFIAFATDTAETLRRNGRFARKYVTSLQYLFETPLPGTVSTREHEAAGRVLFHDIAQLRFLDGMHVSVRPDRMSARQMQEIVVREYQEFYSRVRILRAFLSGLFVRRRRLGEGHRRYLRGLPPVRRLRRWLWLHAQYKFAPLAVLVTGRRRVLAFLKDAEYASYLARLDG